MTGAVKHAAFLKDVSRLAPADRLRVNQRLDGVGTLWAEMPVVQP
jgi:hypothetical protein